MTEFLLNVAGSQALAVSFPDKAVLSSDDRSIFSFSENKMSYSAQNKSKVQGCRLQIDGGLIQNTDLKCDNGLLLSDGRFFLIELKGVDVGHACEQVEKTADFVAARYSNFGFKLFGRIVARKGVPQVDTRRQRLERKLQGRLKIQENRLEEVV